MTTPNTKIIKWLNDYTNWLPKLQWVCWIISVFILAKIFWVWTLHFTAPTEFKPISVNPSSIKKPSKKSNINQLIKMKLFGSQAVRARPVIEQVEDVAETKLDIKLRGIYASADLTKANAIIEDSRGKQAVYFIDDELEGKGQVYLRQVFVKKVILETRGRMETLNLTIDAKVNEVIKINNSSRLKESKSKVLDKRKNRKISKKIKDYQNKFLSDPKSVADVISGRPHFVEGELRGVKISPGKDRKLFQELGLRRGDLITSINGIALTNMQEAMGLMRNAKSIQEMDIVIDRNGESINLLLNLNEK